MIKTIEVDKEIVKVGHCSGSLCIYSMFECVIELVRLIEFLRDCWVPLLACTAATAEQ
jgi:hypothetical protein